MFYPITIVFNMKKPLYPSDKDWDRFFAGMKALKEAQEASQAEWVAFKEAQEASQKASQAAQEKAQEASQAEWAAFKEAQEASQAEWAAFKEAQKASQAAQEKAQKASQAAQEKAQKASQAEWAEIKAAQKETDRKLKETHEIFVGQWGKLMESLVEGGLLQVLRERGILVHHNATNLKREYGEQRFEFDIVSVNGKEVVVTEVKVNLKVKDVDYAVKKLAKFTDFAREYRGKKIYGAVAYLRSSPSAARYAEKKGLFVIKAAAGNIPSIINKKSFKPKDFS